MDVSVGVCYWLMAPDFVKEKSLSAKLCRTCT